MSTTTGGSVAPIGILEPGQISPRRHVPASIPRPEYVDRPSPARYAGPEVKDAATVAAMREAGRLAARAMAEVAKAIVPGVTTDELDRIGHEYLLDHHAYPSTLGYRGFPKSLCTSVNEVICHGIPDSTVLQDGDIVNVDITAFLTVDGLGVHGDTDATYLVGKVDEQSRLLVERTHEAMMRGIKAIAPGRQVNVIGRVIEAYAKRFGYGVVRDFTGHGIGTAFHSGLVDPALRRGPGPRDGHRARHDLHGRADAHPGHLRVGHVGRRLDRRHQGPQAVRPVRAHGPRDRVRRGDPHPALRARSGASRTSGTSAIVQPSRSADATGGALRGDPEVAREDVADLLLTTALSDGTGTRVLVAAS